MPGLPSAFRRVLPLLASVALISCQSPPPPPPPAATAPPPPTAVPTITPTALPTVALPTSAPRPAVPAPPPLEAPEPGAALDPRFGIAEGFRNAATMADIGAGWERIVLSWADIQPDGPNDFSWLGRTLPPSAIAGELRRGVRLAGLLQFTPEWAATDTRDAGRSVPRNLDLPSDDPNNYWGRFVYETVRYYNGRIDEWIIWNEPEFEADDAAGSGSYTWLGTDEQFARLMQVAYESAKRANPRATVSFPGTSYWVDQNPGRPQFYERYLRLVANDPAARARNLYHDAVALNLYRAPDDLVRVYQAFKDIQRRYTADAPLWLLELNAMPTDDRSIPCADMHAGNPIQTTQVQQAAYGVQAFALAAAVGYQRIGFYQMVDDDPCRQSAVWGITRDDGSARPVAASLRTAVQAFSGFLSGQFRPLDRAQPAWSAWPADPTSFLPNWQIYLVALELPGGRRVTVLWNGDGVARQVRVARQGGSGQLTDSQARQLALTSAGQDWVIDLPAATAHFSGDPPGYFFIGGEPRLLLEDSVPQGAPVAPPRLS